ncbi:MAG: ABC transporter permease [Bacteroidales bacterium]|nr:ABC transporter permease [Bacteroidales bacterium]
MKQLVQVFITDLRMNLKHWMGAYMLIVPMAILIVLRFFIPSMESTTTTLAIVTAGPNAVKQEIVEVLNPYAKIKEVSSIDDMEQKLRGIGSVEGLYRDNDADQLVSVLEKSISGNSTFSVASQIIRQHYYKLKNGDSEPVVTFSSGVPEELSARSVISPVASTGGSIFFVFMIIISGFIIGLGIVDDKENGTDRAILVSPVTKTEYFIGKSIYPLILIMVYAIIALLVLGLMDVNILQVYVLAVVSLATTLLFGLLLGALAQNENEAIGVGKLLSWVVMLAILGGTLLPDNWQWAVWWAPFFWIFDMMEGVFTNDIEWIEIAWKSAVTIGLTGVFAVLLRKKISKGLS